MDSQPIDVNPSFVVGQLKMAMRTLNSRHDMPRSGFSNQLSSYLACFIAAQRKEAEILMSGVFNDS